MTGLTKRIDLHAAGIVLAEVAALIIDAAICHQTMVLAMDSYVTSIALACLAALLIFLAGEIAGQALYRGDRPVAIAAIAVGASVVVGVGVVRARYGLGAGSAGSTGVEAAMAGAGDDAAGQVLLAVLVSIFMLGVLALGTKASLDRAQARALRIARDLEVLELDVFDLARERSALEDAFASAQHVVDATIDHMAAEACVRALEYAASLGDADDIIDAMPGLVTASAEGAAPARPAQLGTISEFEDFEGRGAGRFTPDVRRTA